MEAEKYEEMWEMLDQVYRSRIGVGKLSGLNPSGICSFAEKVRGDLDEFIGEVIARAKAVDENAARDAEHNRSEFGERYDRAAPSHDGDLYPVPKDFRP